MFKKLTALLLVICLSIPMLCIGAFADEQAKLVVTDNFNNAAVTVQTSAFNGDNNRYTSDIMNVTRDAANRLLHGTTVSITEEGYEGRAMLISPAYTEEYGEVITERNFIPGQVFVLDEKFNAAELSYQFCVKNRGEGDDEAVRLEAAFATVDHFTNHPGLTFYKDKIVMAGSETEFLYETDVWYTAKYVVENGGAKLCILSDAGEVLAQSAVTGDFPKVTVGFSNPKSAVKGFALAVDNAVVSRYRTGNQETTFSDVSIVHWAYDYVEELHTKGIINGRGNKVFAPSDTVTREEFVKMAVGTILETLSQSESAYTDVDMSAWYAPYVVTAEEIGLTPGISETEFGVGQVISREDVMVVLDRILAEEQIAVDASSVGAFADQSKISAAALSSVQRVVAAGLIQGDDKNKVNPEAGLTRAEVCAVISRLDALVNPVVVEGDRLDQTRPAAFNPENLERKLLGMHDFEKGNVMASTNFSLTNYSGAKLDTNGNAYEGRASYRMSPGEGGVNSITFRVSGLDLKPGDAVLGIAHVKCTGLTDAVMRSGGSGHNKGVRGSIFYNNSTTGENTGHYQTYEVIQRDRDWVTSIQYIDLTHAADSVSFTQYIDAVDQGTAWFDNIAIYKIAHDPFLEAYLETPTYKGLIYGEGGEGDINLTTSLLDYGVINLSDCVVNAKIVDENDNVLMQSQLTDLENEEELRITFSSKDLKMDNDYYLQMSLDDTTKDYQYSFREWILRKRPADYRPNNYFDEYGRFIIDGKPTFFMGIYGMNYLYTTIDDLKGTPFKVLLPYGWTWFNANNVDGVITAGADHALLDYAHENGIKMLTGMGSFTYESATTSGYHTNIFKEPEDERKFYDAISKAMDHPAHLGWYIADEQSPARYGAIKEWETKVFSSNDLSAWTFNTFTYVNNARAEIRMADTSNCSSYLIFKGDGTDDISGVTDRLGGIFNAVPKGNRPLYATLQAGQFYSGLRGPDDMEYRNMAMQAICLGAQGLLYYNYFNMKGEEGNRARPFEVEWPILIDAVEEIETFYPMLLSTDAPPKVNYEAGDWFCHIEKRYDGKTYLFTCNRTRNTQTAKIQLEGVKTIRGLYSGKTYDVDQNGWFEYEYGPIGVEVFEVVQKDYASPECTLKSIGFTNGSTSYIASNPGEQFSKVWDVTVPAGVNTLHYAAKISDKATLYINDKEVSATGDIDISGLKTLKVKVVAEDTRYATDYTYTIVRGETNE